MSVLRAVRRAACDVRAAVRDGGAAACDVHAMACREQRAARSVRTGACDKRSVARSVRTAACGERRASRGVRLLLTGLVLLIASATVRAHRLDELLQAAQVAVSADRIAITMNLTPGVAVADGVVGRLDRDGDGRILPEEAASYGVKVVADLRVSIDGEPLPLTFRRIEVPPMTEFRDGVGTIRIEADASSQARAGAHALRFENRHVVPGSVYLANALLPDSTAVQIRRQQRDIDQQALLIEYDTTSATQRNGAWLLVAAFALLALARFRHVRKPQTADRRLEPPRPHNFPHVRRNCV